MKNKIILAIIIILISPLGLSAQRVKKVYGEYTYYAEPDESPIEAKSIALERAKINALAKEFGTVITQSTTMSESSDDGKEHSFFSQYSESEVEGEWIEDAAEPEYKVIYSDNTGGIVATCKVCGLARKYTNMAAEFEALVLRNHPEQKDADVIFKNSEDMYLYFQSSSDGYVAVYLVDESPTAYCLLPYKSDGDGQQQVKGGEEYVFFSREKAKAEKDMVEHYYLTSSDGIERNKIYVIFSKNSFTKAVDHNTQQSLPRELSYVDFQHWLGRLRAHDPEIGVKSIRIEIRP